MDVVVLPVRDEGYDFGSWATLAVLVIHLTKGSTHVVLIQHTYRGCKQLLEL